MDDQRLPPSFGVLENQLPLPPEVGSTDDVASYGLPPPLTPETTVPTLTQQPGIQTISGATSGTDPTSQAGRVEPVVNNVKPSTLDIEAYQPQQQLMTVRPRVKPTAEIVTNTAPVSTTENRFETIVEPAPQSPAEIPSSPTTTEPPSTRQETIPSQSPPVTMGGAIVHEEEARGIYVYILSGVFIFVAFLYGLASYAVSGIGYSLNSSMTGLYEGALRGLFLLSNPQFVILPAVLVIASLLVLFTALKLRDGSKVSWLLGIGVILLVPVLTAYVAQWILSPLYNDLDKMGTFAIISTSLTPSQMISIMVTVQIGLVLIATLLLVGFGQFRYQSVKLSRSAWSFLVITGVLLLMPHIWYYGSLVMESRGNDYGHEQVSKQAGFHVYQPQEIPGGRIQASRYTLNTSPSALLVGKENFVQAYFDLPPNSRKAPQIDSLIALRQIQVEQGFDVETFIDQLIDDTTKIQEVPLSIAQDSQAYFIAKASSQSPLNLLTFIADDGVLVLLTSSAASEGNLIEFARTLQ